MTCGLIQLVSFGKQDGYLTFNPQITYFKKVYRRHTIFSIELIETIPDQQPEYDNRISFKLNNISDLISKGPANKTEELRLELYEKINNLGIGAQGLGGLTTVLDVKINTFPTHAACLPVAIIPNCASTRHIHFELDGSGPAVLTPPILAFKIFSCQIFGPDS